MCIWHSVNGLPFLQVASLVKVLTEILVDLDAVEIFDALRIDILHDVKQDEPDNRQCDHYNQRHTKLDALPAPIPVTKRDVRQEDERQEKAVDEAEDVREVVNIGE